jgi:hypothetical protein
MKIDFSILFKDKDFDVRKSGDARFMDQKVTHRTSGVTF